MPSLSVSCLSEQIVNESSDAIVFSDVGGIIRLWNRGAEEMFGYSPEQAVGQSLDLIIPENLRARHWEGYYRVMKSGETKYKTGLLSSPGLRKDGTRISLEFSMAILRGDNGDIAGCASVMRDVTARFLKDKEIKERIKALEEEKQQANG
jgi:PAS domain S-box-containing protein